MKTICFLAFGTFPLLSQHDTFYDVGGSELQQVLIGKTDKALCDLWKTAGGAELQQVLIGKELVKKGYNVVFIDFDYGQNQFEVVNGIKVIKTFKPKQKTNIWEYALNIHTLLYAVLKSNADIYFQMSGIYIFPRIYTTIARKPIIYAIPSDSVVSVTGEDRFIIRLFRHFEVSHADHVIVQSNHQKEQLKQNFGKDSTLIKSICVIDKDKVQKNQTPLVLWVSTLWELKQPQIFLDLAKEFPDIEFCMIGGSAPGENEFFDSIKSKAEKIKNLRFLGFIPSMHQVSNYFEKAWVFINTSTVEGFPNTFFHAWSTFTPVLSLNVDPDEVICKNNLGFHSGNFAQMVTDLDTLIKNDDLRQQLGLNGRHYVEKEYNTDQVISQYIELFEKMGE
jgi:glycosyltransferase involved in cell wall biosynthesis